MAKWFPLPEETFVYRNRVNHEQAVMILVPGGEEPQSVIINGVQHELDEETTFLARGHVRRAYESRQEIPSE